MQGPRRRAFERADAKRTEPPLVSATPTAASFDGRRRFAIVAERIVTPTGERRGAVVVDGGRVAAIEDAPPRGVPVYDARDRVLMPGLVDTHVHVNEPGRTEWEGYATATRAAAAGGITTIVDMPLNSIPVTTSVAALETKLAALGGQLTVDCGFYGGLVPGNAGELAAMARRGVLGFKAFMVPSGIDDFPAARRADLAAGMAVLAPLGLPLLVHAELEGEAPALPPPTRPEPYARYLASRPRSWENEAVRVLIGEARASGARVHVVHLSSAEILAEIELAKRHGVRLTVETCPHYLTFAAEEIADGDTRFKCAPPIRERDNRDALWRGLVGGAIDCVVSDHSPCAPALKRLEAGDFEAAWGGIAGLQFGLPALLAGARGHGLDLARTCRLMAEAPARLVGLGARKGRIAVGFDADLVVLSPDAELEVLPELVQHRHKVTPYEGRALRGRVDATFLRGALVYEDGRFHGAPRGHELLGGAL
jgi:allantoinase